MTWVRVANSLFEVVVSVGVPPPCLRSPLCLMLRSGRQVESHRVHLDVSCLAIVLARLHSCDAGNQSNLSLKDMPKIE